MTEPGPSLSPAALLRLPQVARLLFAALVGRLPNGMVPLALVLFARDTGSGYGRAGLLTAAYSLGCCVGGPALSRVMDVRGQRSALVLGGVVSSAALAVLPWVPSGGAIVVALVAGVATPPLEPALRTLWPSVLTPRQVPSAFALDAAAQELIFVLGPLAVLLAQLTGAGGGLVAAALVGVGGTLWFVASHASRSWVPPEHEDRHWLGPLRSRRLSVLYSAIVLVGLTVGVPAVALVAYAESVGDRGLAPWLVAANALGALIGGVAYSPRAPHRDPRRDLLLGLALLVVTYAAQSAVPSSPWVMGLLTVASGLGLPPVLTCVFQLVDEFAPVGTTTEAFAWLISAFLVGSSIGAAAAGSLSDAGHIGGAFVVAGASTLFALAIARTVVRRPGPAMAGGA
ncbi:Predicted arabinose efflux permease, MFS family [Pedococcus dokdonensis]|uniref:Predicted arabinose efflux permease, MFS family n=1 Tax=Pedococcus dokdonensis TaxID=443156 RepID=A0A1H0TF34_9MICO|nr:MFS transporter [Pedococcus dokdonensis]SDP52445.1 Predicted arabinose efflux permease, MFS family [Pedococcus dokdonensis]